MRYFVLFFFAFCSLAYADDALPTNPAAQQGAASTPSVSPNASVTISQSAQQLTQIKTFFGDATYDNLANPTSGITQVGLPEK